jgi:hypothetical protein
MKPSEIGYFGQGVPDPNTMSKLQNAFAENILNNGCIAPLSAKNSSICKSYEERRLRDRRSINRRCLQLPSSPASSCRFCIFKWMTLIGDRSRRDCIYVVIGRPKDFPARQDEGEPFGCCGRCVGIDGVRNRNEGDRVTAALAVTTSLPSAIKECADIIQERRPETRQPRR